MDLVVQHQEVSIPPWSPPDLTCLEHNNYLSQKIWSATIEPCVLAQQFLGLLSYKYVHTIIHLEKGLELDMESLCNQSQPQRNSCLTQCIQSYTQSKGERRPFDFYLEKNVIGKNNLFVLLYFLLCVLLCDELHTARITCLQVWLLRIPFAIILVFDAEWLYFKAHNACKACLCVSMIENGEVKMIVQEDPTIGLERQPICFQRSL